MLYALPNEFVAAILETLGYHHERVAHETSKAWRSLDALVDARARYRATVAAADRTTCDEFLRFIPLPWNGGNTTVVRSLERAIEVLGTKLVPGRVLLRTNADQCMSFAYVVDVEKNCQHGKKPRGPAVSVYRHPTKGESKEGITTPTLACSSISTTDPTERATSTTSSC